MSESEIEQLLELFVQGDAEDQSQLRRGAELAGFDGADGIAGHTHHLGQSRLGELSLGAGFFDAVFQDQLVVHGLMLPVPEVPNT